MTLWDYLDRHPWWALLLLAIVGLALPSLVTVRIVREEPGE